jgi:hypothetical protein
MTQMKPGRAAFFHEDLFRQEDLRPSSDRTFGLAFAGFFGLVAIIPLFRGHAVRPWALIVAATFLTISVTLPRILKPVNKLWLQLGQIVQKATNPIVMGLVFFSAIVPISALMRRTKRDPLRLRRDRHADSYWISRRPPGPDRESMKDQF